MSTWWGNMAANKIAALIDLNLVMDVLDKREPHVAASAAVWRAVETGQIRGYLAAHSITTLFYLVARQIGWQQATAVVKEVLQVFSIAAVDEQVIHQSVQFWAGAILRTRCRWPPPDSTTSITSSPAIPKILRPSP